MPNAKDFIPFTLYSDGGIPGLQSWSEQSKYRRSEHNVQRSFAYDLKSVEFYDPNHGGTESRSQLLSSYFNVGVCSPMPSRWQIQLTVLASRRSCNE